MAYLTYNDNYNNIFNFLKSILYLKTMNNKKLEKLFISKDNIVIRLISSWGNFRWNACI